MLRLSILAVMVVLFFVDGMTIRVTPASESSLVVIIGFFIACLLGMGIGFSALRASRTFSGADLFRIAGLRESLVERRFLIL